MKRVFFPLFYLLFFLLGPVYGQADDTMATPVNTPTPPAPGRGVTAAPFPAADLGLGRRYYAFDAVLKSAKDPLNDPQGIAISPSTGGLIIADAGNNRVAYWDEDGTPLKSVGSFGSRADWQNPPQFSGPCGVFEGQDKKLYVADTLNNRVVIVDGNGMVFSTWGEQGSEHGEFNQPRAITADHFGDLWVLDTGNSRVEIFTPTGEFNSSRGTFGTEDDLPQNAYPTPGFPGTPTPTAGPRRHHHRQSTGGTSRPAGAGNGKAYFNNPMGMAVNSIDQLVVADTGNFRFEVFNHQGAQPVTQEGWFGEGPYQFKEPAGAAVTRQGWIVIADGQNGGINLYNSRNGAFEFISGWRARDENILPNYQPQFRGVACDSRDRIYLTDIKNNLIIRLKPVYDTSEVVLPTRTPTPVEAIPYGGNGYPIR